MNESFDELQRELQMLRPRSATPELRRSVEHQLARRLTWPLGLAGTAVAAAIAAVIFTTPSVAPPSPPPAAPQVAVKRPTTIADQQPRKNNLRTLWDYRRMSIEQGEEIDFVIESSLPVTVRKPDEPTRAMLSATNPSWD